MTTRWYDLWVSSIFTIAAVGMFSDTLAVAEPVIWCTSSGGTGHAYEAVAVSPGTVPWGIAEVLANRRGGHLAAVQSEAENHFLFELVDSNEFWTASGTGSIDGPWLGGVQIMSTANANANWAWSTGEDWVYAQWSPGNPNDLGGSSDNQRYVHFFTTAGTRASTWNDAQCERALVSGYIIEWDGFILHQPEHSAVCPGEVASFNVISAVQGVSFQWRQNGIPIDLAANPSAVEPTLSIPNASAASAGFYDCIVTIEGCATSRSDPAYLLVGAGGACCSGSACSVVVGSCVCSAFACNVSDLLPPTFNGCFGDADGNGIVNAGDRGFVAANIGLSAPDLVCKFDMDGNGTINAGDRGFVSANIELCAPLPDYQNGSGLNAGVPDSRFADPVFMGAGTTCDNTSCP